MVVSYKTIVSDYEAMIMEKKSKFICILKPIVTEEQAKSYIEAIRKEHYNANHHCIAYRIGLKDPLERYGDDGEPSGTAGMPMLEVLRGANLTNILAVVIRYFGGTKLGTGGLVRAYTESVQTGLDHAELITKIHMTLLGITVDYTLSGKVEYAIHQDDCILKDTVYESNVTYQVYMPTDRVDLIRGKIVELTAAKSDITIIKTCYVYQMDGVYIEEDA